MKNITRRNFVKATSSLLALTAVAPTSYFKKKEQLLSFSTLGCPDWSFQKIVDFAVANEYSGLELRGILRQMDLTKCPEFNSAAAIADTRKLMSDKGLKFVDLGSSATMHFPEGAERQKNLDEAKRFIDLAQQLSCPYIRVFPNNFPKDQDKKTTMDLIAKGLVELGAYAKGSNVMVLMETHGDLVHAADVVTIMQTAASSKVGLVWDIVNMWSVTKEPPAQVYQKLKPYIHHTHIKDLKMVDGKEQYTLLGKGEAPVFEGIAALLKGGYKEYYSFEWEKLWHPEIAAPELALADYPKTMHYFFDTHISS